MLDCLLQCTAFTRMCWLFLKKNSSKVQFPVLREEGRQDYFRDLKPRPHLPALFWQDLCDTTFMNNKCFLSLPQYFFASFEAFKRSATGKASHKDIVVQFLALMDGSGFQTVRWDVVKSILPGIELKINNSPTEREHECRFSPYCLYVDSLLI